MERKKELKKKKVLWDPPVWSALLCGTEASMAGPAGLTRSIPLAGFSREPAARTRRRKYDPRAHGTKVEGDSSFSPNLKVNSCQGLLSRFSDPTTPFPGPAAGDDTE